MKQFDLEEYLKNPSRKVVTRDGQSVKIHCTNFESISGRLIVAEIEGSGYSATFFKNGKYFKSEETPLDLFFATEKYEGWINIYKDAYNNYIGQPRIFESKEDAEKDGKGCKAYIAAVKIEWEE